MLSRTKLLTAFVIFFLGGGKVKIASSSRRWCKNSSDKFGWVCRRFSLKSQGRHISEGVKKPTFLKIVSVKLAAKIKVVMWIQCSRCMIHTKKYYIMYKTTRE